MTDLDGFSRLLKTLREDETIPKSAVGMRSLRRLRPLLDSGVLAEEPSGGGWRLVLVHKEALGRFIAAKYPSGIDAPRLDLPPRAAAVAMFRDAKRARAARAFPVVLRGFRGASLQLGEVILDVAAQTSTAGAACLLVDQDCAWSFGGTLAVVENLELFLHVETVLPAADLVLFAFGRLKATVKTWLASPAMTTTRIVHFGDYDPTGLDEYWRLRERCGERVEFFLPENLDALVEKYGDQSRLEKSARLVPLLRQRRDAVINGVLDIIEKHGRGLDHEALLISMLRRQG